MKSGPAGSSFFTASLPIMKIFQSWMSSRLSLSLSGGEVKKKAPANMVMKYPEGDYHSCMESAPQAQSSELLKTSVHSRCHILSIHREYTETDWLCI
jgi:hypothetical protein